MAFYAGDAQPAGSAWVAGTSSHPQQFHQKAPKHHSGGLGMESSHIIAGSVQPQTPAPHLSPRHGCAGGSLEVALSTTRLGGQKLSEPAQPPREPSVLWHEKSSTTSSTFTCPCITKAMKQRGIGSNILKMDSILGSLSIIRVHRLVARNKHFSIADFTDFLKIIFH